MNAIKTFLKWSARRFGYYQFRSFWQRISTRKLDLGRLNASQPVRPDFGLGHGMPVDRYYIAKFLAAHALDISGHVVEIGSDSYMRRFGGNRVSRSDIIHVSAETKQATIIVDLCAGDHLPANQFDCIICTQTLHFIFDVRTAISTLCRILKPGGVLLATFPGIAQISRYDMDHWGEYWRFTSLSAAQLFKSASPASEVTVTVFGNVYAATALLQGLVVEELSPDLLMKLDPNYEVLIGVRVLKAEVAS
jgi:SAM-dependent methyltransferase